MVYDVRIINDGLSLSSYIQFIVAIISAVTLFILIYDKIKRRKAEKMKLIITPKMKFPNVIDEIFYLYLSFSNESSLPISILDLRVYQSGDYATAYTSSDDECGTLTVDHVNVIETNGTKRTVKKDYDSLSETVPIVIEPYSVSSGYFAFYKKGQDSFILCHKEIELFVTTSRKMYKIEMNLNVGNIYDSSYRDDGLVFGKNGESKQDTSIPDNY